MCHWPLAADPGDDLAVVGATHVSPESGASWPGPRVVTFKSGGAVKSFTAYARGGAIEASDAVAKATKLPGGAGGGKGRLAKARMY